MERKTRIWENVAILGIGVVLVCVYNQADLFMWIISLVGIMFILPSVIGMVGQANQDKRAREVAEQSGAKRKGRMNSLMSWVTCIGGLLIGLVFILLWKQFESVLAFLMGAIVLAGGIYHFYELAVGYEDVEFPGWFYAFPVVLALGGAYLLLAKPIFGSQPSNATTAMVTGLGMIVFAVTSLLEVTTASVSRKKNGGNKEDKSKALASGGGDAVAKRSRDDDFYVDNSGANGGSKYTQTADPE